MSYTVLKNVNISIIQLGYRSYAVHNVHPKVRTNMKMNTHLNIYIN